MGQTIEVRRAIWVRRRLRVFLFGRSAQPETRAQNSVVGTTSRAVGGDPGRRRQRGEQPQPLVERRERRVGWEAAVCSTRASAAATSRIGRRGRRLCGEVLVHLGELGRVVRSRARARGQARRGADAAAPDRARATTAGGRPRNHPAVLSGRAPASRYSASLELRGRGRAGGRRRCARSSADRAS